MQTKWATQIVFWGLLGSAVGPYSALAHKPGGHDHRDNHPHTHSHQTHHQHGAHVHGNAVLNVVLEGQNLQIMLESPAQNIIGFESRAATQEQITLIKRAKQILASEDWLSLSPACQLAEKQVDFSAVEPEAAHQHNGKQHGHHADIHAHLKLHCLPAPQTLAITVNLFDAFPGIETLTVQWVSDSAQGQQRLTAHQRQLRLTR